MQTIYLVLYGYEGLYHHLVAHTYNDALYLAMNTISNFVEGNWEYLREHYSLDIDEIETLKQYIQKEKYENALEFWNEITTYQVVINVINPEDIYSYKDPIKKISEIDFKF